MKSILETITDGSAYLAKKGVENPRLNMEHLLAHVLKVKRMQLYLWFDRPMVESELAPLRELTIRRGKREPLQHILGTVEFCSHTFLCDKRGLIPRFETEELADALIKRHKIERPVPKRILDMGTGSGVLGLTLALSWPEAAVTLVDLSPEALELAKENAVKCGVTETRLTTVQSNLFHNVPAGDFDLIVANLPYISPEEIKTLSPEVHHDPLMALDGLNGLGTAIMEEFIRQLPGKLAPGGLVAMEIGPGQGDLLAQSLTAAGFLNAVATKDLQGRERFVFAENGAAAASDK